MNTNLNRIEMYHMCYILVCISWQIILWNSGPVLFILQQMLYSYMDTLHKLNKCFDLWYFVVWYDSVPGGV